MVHLVYLVHLVWMVDLAGLVDPVENVKIDRVVRFVTAGEFVEIVTHRVQERLEGHKIIRFFISSFRPFG